VAFLDKLEEMPGDLMPLVTTARTTTSRNRRGMGPGEPGRSGSTSRVVQLTPQRAVWLPLIFVCGLAGFALLDSVRQSTPLLWSVSGAAAALSAWTAVLFGSAIHQRRVLTLEIMLRKQHYLQACAQGSVLLYWGLYWPRVQEWAPLIVAQLVFGYGFDLLLSWSRHQKFALGFGPFPIIFSINLFLWFKQDWFYLQFFMVALGFLAKQLFQWNKEGRRTHIFNPSAFTLAVFSIALLVTGATGITWGPEIAITQFYPPHIYLVLFLIGLPGQFFFGVTSMTMSAVVATYLFSLLYFTLTGVYLFYDSYIPIAVFLGMHLLFTDPSTSPRTELGRIVFGALYGLSTVALYVLLGKAGLPTFYDKLLQVPILNLSINAIDRAVGSRTFGRFDPAALGRSLAPRQRNLAYISIWILVFATINAAQGVGDHHPGQWLPFWQQACREGRPAACSFLTARLSAHCAEGSGWACNEAGIRTAALSQPRSGHGDGDSVRFGPAPANASFERGCELGFAPACENVLRIVSGTGAPASAPPTVADYPIILRGSKTEITERRPEALHAMACDQGWPHTCGQRDQGGGRSPVKTINAEGAEAAEKSE
jgi:hypothetical protein